MNLNHRIGFSVVVRLKVEYHICEHDSSGIDNQRSDLIAYSLVENGLLKGLETAGVEGDPVLPGVHDGGDHGVLVDGRQRGGALQLAHGGQVVVHAAEAQGEHEHGRALLCAHELERRHHVALHHLHVGRAGDRQELLLLHQLRLE